MKTSIIIPTIGRKTLSDVLNAILQSDNFQQINPEIIVVFDGMIARTPVKNPNIKYLSTPKKVFAGGARNLALDKATGDIVIFIGDDTIPLKDWLNKHYSFHQQNPSSQKVLLGKISWPKRLQKDPLHRFLENGAQFNFKQIERQGPDWHHFYTSNISLKKAFIAQERFSSEFKGWGFEDIELGYRLHKQGMQIAYDKHTEVIHEDPQTLASMITRTKNARKNALIFEKIHPNLKIQPTSIKKFILKTVLRLTAPIALIHKSTSYWRAWKQAWIGM